MKSVISMCLCVILVCSLTACMKKLPPTDLEIIERATQDIKTLEEAPTDSFPEAEFAYDNETPADQAGSIEGVTISLPYMSTLTGAFWTEDDIADAGILLRYHRGRYYSINPRKDGNYDIYFFEVQSGELWDAEDDVLCPTNHILGIPGSVADSKKFFQVARVGATRKKIEKYAQSVSLDDERNRMYLLDNGMNILISYNDDGKVEAFDGTNDDIDNASAIGVNISLAYLLPQDLALIS